MTKLLSIAGCIAASLVLASPHLWAQEGPPPEREGRIGSRVQRGFEAMDADGDGKVTSDEFRGPEQMFKGLDTDGDGSVTREEMQNIRQRFSNRPMGGFDPAQFEQRIIDQHKQALGATDDEWQAIEPLVKGVFEARRATMTARMGGMGMMGGFGFGGPGAPGGPMGPGPGMTGGGAEEFQALRDALADPDASSETLQEKLTALRQARSEADNKLKEAQDKLREVLTLRQEATLVLMGTLE
jgi:hypothetical protein